MLRAPYPSKSNNVNKNKVSFANAAGEEFDVRDWQGAEVYTAPVARYEENDFLVNSYGKSIENPQGKVGLRFADRVLEGNIPEEGQQMVVTLFEPGTDPSSTESHRAILDIEESPYPDDLDSEISYPMLIEKAPDGMEYGLHDFVVNHYGGNHIVANSGQNESEDLGLSGVVNLEDMA